ncbi:MAG TPA: hypothetical protein VHT91_11810 [Kofleriaceae bacterium]|jgi:hypothetical protein|nr:hypothetical protein [Kofleriaceae bacterium]
MKNLRLIAGLFITTAFFVGCGVSSDPGEESIRIDHPTVTHQGGVSTITNGDVTVTTSSLSLTEQSDLLDPEGGGGTGVCCTRCNIYTGDCAECHTCPLNGT